MKKIRSVVLVFAPAAIGAVAFACGSYPFPMLNDNTAGGSGGTDTGTAISCTPDPSITGNLPCDVLAKGCNKCVTAHSTVRVLVSGYTGPLYEVCKGQADPGPNSCKGQALNIGSVDGYADAAAQDTFCAGAICYITKIFDQTPNHNDLEPSPPGGNKNSPDNPANATALKTSVNGHPAYGIRIKPLMGYRTGCSECTIKTGIGIPLGDEPETEYMVTSKNYTINGCCFDYGNAETTSHDDGNGTMEAVYFGQGVIWGTGSGAGPWAMADLENGVYAGWENKQDRNISTNTTLAFDYVTAAIVGDTRQRNGGKGRFAVYGGDATNGPITTMYDGIRPEKPGYVPMQKQGSLILGTGGDNSAAGAGCFYEGVMATGAATKATIDALQASIVAAGYGK